MVHYILPKIEAGDVVSDRDEMLCVCSLTDNKVNSVTKNNILFCKYNSVIQLIHHTFLTPEVVRSRPFSAHMLFMCRARPVTKRRVDALRKVFENYDQWVTTSRLMYEANKRVSFCCRCFDRQYILQTLRLLYEGEENPFKRRVRYEDDDEVPDIQPEPMPSTSAAASIPTSQRLQEVSGRLRALEDSIESIKSENEDLTTVLENKRDRLEELNDQLLTSSTVTDFRTDLLRAQGSAMDMESGIIEYTTAVSDAVNALSELHLQVRLTIPTQIFGDLLNSLQETSARLPQHMQFLEECLQETQLMVEN